MKMTEFITVYPVSGGIVTGLHHFYESSSFKRHVEFSALDLILPDLVDSKTFYVFLNLQTQSDNGYCCLTRGTQSFSNGATEILGCYYIIALFAIFAVVRCVFSIYFVLVNYF